jgi:uncharacterized protein YcnI
LGASKTFRACGSWKRALSGTLLAIAVSFAATSSAHGHAVVQPAASRPAEQQIYTLTVASERDTDVVSVSLQVPPEVESILVRETPGWDVSLQREGDRIAVVRWSGNRIRPDRYQSFTFIGRNPVRETELEWKILQRYTDATDRWIGPPDSENPASRTRITETAIPEDVIDTSQGTTKPAQAAAGAGGQAANEDPAADGGNDTLPLVLSILALVAGLGALTLSLLDRRRRA